MQCSVHPPSSFIRTHSDKLLPEWGCPIASVVIVLQRATCDFQERTPLTETQKHRLRDRFLDWGTAIAMELNQRGYLAELFDPKTGYPIFSQPGSLCLNDVAVVRACLGYPVTHIQGCSVALHPDWGSAVYPSVLVSSAEPEWVVELTRRLSGMGGSAERGAVHFSRSENHQSFIGCGSWTQ